MMGQSFPVGRCRICCHLGKNLEMRLMPRYFKLEPFDLCFFLVQSMVSQLFYGLGSFISWMCLIYCK
ncbi:hypothetical protein ACSBR1_020994 [Camellia fascicularis]